MELQKLGRKDRRLLLEALDFDIMELRCQYCEEPADFGTCCIMPACNTKKKATILCDSILCMTEYLEDADRGE